MSQKEDIQKDDCCGTLMINTKVVNSNKVHASGNTDEEVATCSNVTYSMLNGLGHLLLPLEIYHIVVHSRGYASRRMIIYISVLVEM